MIIDIDELYKRLVENQLAIDTVNQITKKQVRYSHDVMVGTTNPEKTKFLLHAQNKSVQRRNSTDKIIRELFADAENVEIGKPIGEIIAA